MGTKVSDKLVIKRKQWMNADYNRKKGTNSVLWSRSNDVGCCLGHYLRMKGFTTSELTGIGEPVDLYDIDNGGTAAGLVNEAPEVGNSFHPDWVEKAMHINDKLPAMRAEPQLIELFKKHANCELTFED